MSNTCVGAWQNGLLQNTKIDEKHDEEGVEDGFQLATVKFDRDREGGREALRMWNCFIDI